MKIGITERGDASVNYRWIDHMDEVNGAILITKNITDEFIEKVVPFKDKVIVHATCTGYGGTVLEPNVPSYMKQLAQAQKLVDAGFPMHHMVIRVDPIIPTDKGIRLAQTVIRAANESYGFWRFRVSVIDMYPYIRKRFVDNGLPLPYGEDQMTASPKQFAAVDEMLDDLLESHRIRIESCAEKNLNAPMWTGCVSDYDARILGISLPERGYIWPNRRVGCKCLPEKTELLNTCHPCKHNCLYCYWKKASEQ